MAWLNYQSALMTVMKVFPIRSTCTRLPPKLQALVATVANHANYLLDVPPPPNHYKDSLNGGLNGTFDIFPFSLGVTPNSKLPSCS